MSLTILCYYRPQHMRQLYELSVAPQKIWKPLPGGDHNSSVLEEGYFESISDFIADVTGGSKEKQNL
jgi:abhydrolase domain-containing protein 13